MNIEWYIGGAINVDETFLSLFSFRPSSSSSSKPKLTSTEDFTSYLSYISNDHMIEKALASSKSNSNLRSSSATSHHHHRHPYEKYNEHFDIHILPSSIHKNGKSRWDLTASSSSMLNDTKVDPLLPRNLFKVNDIPLEALLSSKDLRSGSTINSDGKYVFWLIAWSSVDSSFGKKGQGYPEGIEPQAYYSNIRTNPLWDCSPVIDKQNNLSKHCQGRRYWPSDYIEIIIDQNFTTITVQSVEHCSWWEFASNKKESFQIKSKVSSSSTSSLSSLLPPLSSFSINTSSFTTSGNDSIIMIPYHIFYQSDENTFFTTERIYLVICLLLTVLVTVLSLIASYLRRNRVYSALINNRYLNLPTGFQR
jgi:hypothetical protein